MGWSTSDIPDQRGRVALVTGANSGLGLETARALVTRGATVILACRSLERAEAARLELTASDGGSVEGLQLDLADLRSVAAAAAQLSHEQNRLDLLINNAGIMAIPRQLSADGFERQFATNHLGHFALTQALLPLLLETPGSRVVTVTSGAQHFGRIAFEDLQGERRYDRWRAYCQSKLANTLFALELHQRLQTLGSGTLSLAAHPGLRVIGLDQDPTARAAAAIQPAQRVIVTTHDALGYYAARYGFTVAGVILPGGGSEIVVSKPDAFRQQIESDYVKFGRMSDVLKAQK